MENIHQKILIEENFKPILKEIGSSGRTIILAYGHFNVIHPGHLRFLKYARGLGDYLVIALQGDRYIDDKTKDLFFHQNERAMGVAALEYVDKVIVLDQTFFEDVVKLIKPAHFVLGKEYEGNQSELIRRYINSVENEGGSVVFRSGEIKYASTEFLFQSQENIEHTKVTAFKKACQQNNIDLHQIKQKLDLLSNARILVVGDSIVDQYVACDALGMSAEAPVLAIKELESKQFIGGGAIVAGHIKSLGPKCHYLTVTGDDEPGHFLQNEMDELGIQSTLLKDTERPTTFKIRYMVNNQKMLRVSRMKDHSISRHLENKLLETIESLAKDLDGIVLCDFVYGVLTKRVLSNITSLAKAGKIKLFGDLQCSSQIGNVCRFKEFDLITPTEREARIAVSDNESGLEKLAHIILSETQSKNLLITLGSNGFIAYQGLNGSVIKNQHFPALNSNPVDVTGAGDTLLAVMSAGLSSGLGIMETAALGACASAASISRLGNIPVTQNEIKMYLNKMINQF